MLNARLNKGLEGIPGINSEVIKDTGATDMLDIIGKQYRATALEAYNDALHVVFQVGLCMACLAIPGALAMEWRTVKKKMPPRNPDGAHVAEKGNAQGNAGEQEAPTIRAEEAVAKEMAVNAAGDEKYQGREATVAESTVSSDATNTATQSEGKPA